MKRTIGFDAKRVVHNRTGLGNYGRTLVHELSTQFHDTDLLLYAPDAGCDDLRESVEGLPNVRMVYPEGLRYRLQRDYWRSRSIIRDLQRDHIDLFHGLTGELPNGIKKAGIPAVVTIHDLIFMRHPAYYKWLDAHIYAYKFRRACREADRIIAISECTKRDIIELGGVSPDRIDVVYQSCTPCFKSNVTPEDQQAIRHRYALPSRFILNVGTIEERKNVLLAAKALLRLPEDIGLVVIGKKMPYTECVQAFIKEHRLQRRVILLHDVSNADLSVIYTMAESFVFPSRYEGFGIPIIEAINNGLPVVACTGSCLEETGGEHCLYVSPDDDEALAAAIRQTLKGAEGRQQRIALSQQYVRRFDGNIVAKQIQEIYERVMVIR